MGNVQYMCSVDFAGMYFCLCVDCCLFLLFLFIDSIVKTAKCVNTGVQEKFPQSDNKVYCIIVS